jgi:dolichyl-phosphate-mannose--protein O-mannosyl transferase
LAEQDPDQPASSSPQAAKPAIAVRRAVVISAVFYGIAQLLFLVNIQFPRGHNFDETYYVRSAKQFIERRDNQNLEHPPLGKELMAIGIECFGDTPLGWRVMSTFLGSLTLAGMFLWGLAVFRDQGIAIWIGVVTLFNQLLYVQSRIGMLDTFMTCFLVWGLAAFCAAWSTRRAAAATRRYLIFAGVMFGLATACKWLSVVPWMVSVGLILAVKVFQRWGVSFRGSSGDASEEDFYAPELFRGISHRQLALWLGAVPVAVYLLTFVPYLFIERTPAYTLWDLVVMQREMWDDQLRVEDVHPYMSNWVSWPVMTRPIWYAFDPEPGHPGYARAVLLLGNPLVMWLGLAGVAVCIREWLLRRARDAFLISVFYLVFVFCWALIPRIIGYYYYYYPAGMTLALALAGAFRRFERKRFNVRLVRWAFAGAAGALFVYFFPILSAMKIRSADFRGWMWLSSWI